MKQNIAADCESDSSQINIKATTSEKMGFVGRKEGIAVMAVCLLGKK
jgi:2-C-methyl-D-erythritol 2,4-cyclodiphosphate synthase